MKNNFSLNIGGRLLTLQRPLVMGIMNVTDDSFYAESRTLADGVAARVKRMLDEGADIINDISLSVSASPEEALEIAKGRLARARVSTRGVTLSVYRKSVDARKKKDIRFVYSVLAREVQEDILASTQHE